MTRLQSRVQGAYERKVKRWRDAWTEVGRTFYGSYSRAEVDALLDWWVGDYPDEMRYAISDTLRRWYPEDPHDDEEVSAVQIGFYDAFLKAWPTVDEMDTAPDLTKWPEGLPPVPALLDEGEEKLREDVRIARREMRADGAGELERLTAGAVFWHVALFRTAGRYSG